MAQGISVNALTVRAIAAGNQAALRMLGDFTLIALGSLCPECNGRNTETNGGGGMKADTILCLDCNDQFDIESALAYRSEEILSALGV